MKISIIMPVHNSEAYLQESIESILGQSFVDFELLLIINNCNDLSQQICETNQKLDERIRIFIESKSGAAAARNRGLKEAVGEYITFVDSDDLLVENAIELLLNQIEKDSSDIVIGEYTCIDEVGNKIRWYVPDFLKYMKIAPLSGKSACEIFLRSRDIEGFAWGKLFRKKLVVDSGFKFDEKKIAYEDMAEVFEILTKCEKVSFVGRNIYLYRQCSSSLVHNNYKTKEQDYEKALFQIYRRAVALGLKREASSSLRYRFVLRDYSIKKHRSWDARKYFGDFIEIARYQKTEKWKTLIKLTCLYIKYK